LAPSAPPPPAAAQVDWDILTIALSLGLVASVITIAVLVGRHSKVLLKRSHRWHGQGLPAGAQWKISDSWASNLTAITAALGALVTVISDKVSSVFDDSAIPVFAITTALMLVVAAIGPLAYTTLQQYHPGGGTGDHLEGTGPGLLIGTWVTLLAVMGSLAAVGATTRHIPGLGTGPRSAVWIVLGVVAIGVAVYALRTIDWLIRDANSTPSTKRSLAGVTTVNCCEPETSPAARRMSLL
jgi:hypothetical protein